MGVTLFLSSTFFIFAWICSVRSTDCTDILRASCTGLSVRTFVGTDIQPTTQVTITCDATSEMLNGWSLSSDGSPNRTLLNTSLSKYTVNGDTLTINNINRTDEGLYRCIYQQGLQDDKKCIYVYGRAVFASCLLDFTGCTVNPTQLSVTAGVSVNLNATVTHIRGGNCGFEQEITRVQLTKLNEGFGVPDQTLLTCDTSSVTCSHGRVSLDRGRDPGIEFVFTISNTNANDAGMYEVVVEVRDPSTGSQPSIRKRFHLEATPGSETTAGDTPVIVTTAGTSDEIDSGIHTSVSSTLPHPRESIIPVVIPSAFGLLAAILLIVIVAVVGVVIVCKKASGSTNEEEGIPVNPNPTYHHSSHIVSVEENVINNTLLCVREPLDVRMKGNNQEGNEQQNYATISQGTQPIKDGRTESDYVSPSFTLGNSHLNSSPQKVSLFRESINEELNNQEYHHD